MFVVKMPIEILSVKQLKVVVDKSVRLIIRFVITLGFVPQFVKPDVLQFITNRVTLSKLLLLPHPSFLSHFRKSQIKMATAACHRPPIVTFPP